MTSRAIRMLGSSVLASVAALSLASMALAAPVRHIICNQLDWANNVGLILEIGNDQAKDDVIAPLKSASVSAGLGTGAKWRFVSYNTTKWEMNKEYALKFIVAADAAELWVDGKRRGTSKGTFKMFDAKPEMNGVPTFATGQAAYGVYVKSFKITTNDGNDYEVDYPRDSWEPRMATSFPEAWKLEEYDTAFTIDVVLSFLPAE